jgi:hypothetical protein
MAWLISRSAACLLSLAVISTLIVASVRIDSASEEIATAPAAADQIDVSALATAVNPASLPLLAVRDPI